MNALAVCNNAGFNLRLMLLVALAIAASGLWSPALAQDAPPPGAPRTCDDAFADIYFMPDAPNTRTACRPA